MDEIESRILNTLAARFDQPDGLLRELGADVLQALRMNLLTGSFAPDAPATLAEKARKGQPERPLLATGGLLDSLRPDGPDSVLSIQGNAVLAGTKKPYAAPLVTGTSRMPARDFTDLHGEAMTKLLDLAVNAILGDSV